MVSFRIDRLKELRKDLGLTQKQFSEKIGCTMASLSAYENGSKLPPTQTLIAISKNFNCSIDWLMGLKDERNYDNSSNSIKTYSDYIKKLFALQNSPITLEKGCDCSSTTKNLTSCKGIAFWDPVIKLFLESWNKTFSLYKEGTIDDTIYGAWKEKVLRDFKYRILADDVDWEVFHQSYFMFSSCPDFSEYDAVQSALVDMNSPSITPDFPQDEITFDMDIKDFLPDQVKPKDITKK